MKNDLSAAAVKAVKKFMIIAKAEGWSYLILLGAAMPLKYMADMPAAVKYVGWIHGVLFVAYMLSLVQASALGKWSFKQTAWAFLASLLPFGAFILDRQLKQQYPTLATAS